MRNYHLKIQKIPKSKVNPQSSPDLGSDFDMEDMEIS